MGILYYNEDGILKSKKININIDGGKVNEIGYNAPREINFNGKHVFFKISEASWKSLDKYEFLVSIIGTEMGVKMANNFFYVSEDGKMGNISESVLNEEETLMMTNQLFDYIMNKHMISEEKLEEIKKFRMGLSEVSDSACMLRIAKTKADILKNINLFILAITTANVKNAEEIIKDYIKMVYFDSVIGNKDRNTKNYGLIVGKDDNVRFSPLFDSATICMPKVEDNYVGLNSVLMDRKMTKEVLKEFYPEIISELDEQRALKSLILQQSISILDESELQTFINEIYNIKNKSSETLDETIFLERKIGDTLKSR